MSRRYSRSLSAILINSEIHTNPSRTAHNARWVGSFRGTDHSHLLLTIFRGRDRSHFEGAGSTEKRRPLCTSRFLAQCLHFDLVGDGRIGNFAVIREKKGF